MKRKLLGSISYVMLIMIMSRVLSLVSTQFYMSHFGVGDVKINIYSYAISLPNIIFNCFGTALSTVVIPIYTDYISNNRRDKAKRFADNIITVATVFTAALVVVGIALSPVLPSITEFDTTPEIRGFCTKALMIMMPAMLFYGLNYIFQGMLQSEGVFGWPAFVSVPSSLIVILYVVFLSDRFGVSGLLVATLIGLASQALILVPPLIKKGYRYKPSFSLKDPDIIKAGKMTVPVLLGASSYQLNMFFNINMIANFDGMVTLLTFVQNLILNMVLAFVYSITAVLYPKLTEFASTGRMDEYKKTLGNVLNSVILLLIPITFGLLCVRTELLDLITKWGKIESGDVANASMLIAMYSIGIIGIGLKEILDRAFYALKETRVSAVNGFIIMVINIVLSLILVRSMKAFGIPLAYSVASLTGSVILLVLLKRKVGNYLQSTLSVFFKSLASALVMSAGVIAVSKLLAGVLSDGLATRLIKLFVPAGVGVVIYAVMLLILRVDPIRSVASRLLSKIFGSKKES